MKNVPALTLAAACVPLLLFAACDAAPAPAPPPPPQVVVAAPTQRDVTIVRDFTGNTRAIESVELRARVPGLLMEAGFDAGSRVEAGDVLFVIEPDLYAAALDQAEAEVEGAEAFLERTRSDLERLEEAIKTNAVSQQEVARATADRDQATAALRAAKARREKAQIDLDYTRIETPISGVISRRLVDPGNLVGTSEPTLLARVFGIDPIHVYFDVNEQAIAQALERMGGLSAFKTEDPALVPITVSVDGIETTFEGIVDYVDPAADSETGTVQVRAVVPNDEGRLLPGFFVRIRLPGETLPAAVLVPETALGTDLGGRFVLLVDGDGLVEKRYVVPGQLEDDNLRVILEGLEPDDSVIVEGLQRARPGMPVTAEGA